MSLILLRNTAVLVISAAVTFFTVNYFTQQPQRDGILTQRMAVQEEPFVYPEIQERNATSGKAVISSTSSVSQKKVPPRVVISVDENTPTLVAPSLARQDIAVFKIDNNSPDDVVLKSLIVAVNGTLQKGQLTVESLDTRNDLNVQTIQPQVNATSGEIFTTDIALSAGTSLSIWMRGTLEGEDTIGKILEVSLVGGGINKRTGKTFTIEPIVGRKIQVVASSRNVFASAEMPVSTIFVPKTFASVYRMQLKPNADTVLRALTFDVAGGANVEEFALGFHGQRAVAINGKLTFSGLNIPIYTDGENEFSVIAYIKDASDFTRDPSGAPFTLSYTHGSTTVVGNTMYTYRSKPALLLQPLESTRLKNGVQSIANIRVLADPAGPIAWRKMTVELERPPHIAIDDLRLYVGDTELSGVKLTASGNRVALVVDHDVIVNNSAQYVLKANVQHARVGDTLSVQLPVSGVLLSGPLPYALAAQGSSFVWTDFNAKNHSALTFDWMNEYLIKLVTDAQVLRM